MRESRLRGVFFAMNFSKVMDILQNLWPEVCVVVGATIRSLQSDWLMLLFHRHLLRHLRLLLLLPSNLPSLLLLIQCLLSTFPRLNRCRSLSSLTTWCGGWALTRISVCLDSANTLHGVKARRLRTHKLTRMILTGGLVVDQIVWRDSAPRTEMLHP